MTLDQAKQELIKRYRYLYENACFVLAPYMYEQSEEEFKRLTDENIKKYKNKLFEKPLICLKISREDTLNSLFEELLLSDKPVEDSTPQENATEHSSDVSISKSKSRRRFLSLFKK